MGQILKDLFATYSIIIGIITISLIMFLANQIGKLLKERQMNSAIAIILGLVFAYIGGRLTGGSKGLADIQIFSGISILGGSMIRDFAIISTAYGADLKKLKESGVPGIISLFIGIFFSFFLGAFIAYVFGYTDPVELTTIGAGAVTFIVGPVTGEALGASSDVIALSIAIGVVKSILTMIITPIIADKIKLDNPTSAMVFGGLMGTTSGVTGGLVAVNPALVPYGAMTATFYTGMGSLLIPSLGYLIIRLIIS